jgi:guanine deaminase
MIIRTNILNPVSVDKCEFRKDVFLAIDNGKILSITDTIPVDTDFLDYSNLLCLPGMIDTHTHLSQWFIRGRYKNNLLDWLNDYVFPEELRSFDTVYAQMTAETFFKNLIKSGTTTAGVYVSASKTATNLAFVEGKKSGMRLIMGQVMMDMNSPDYLIQDTKTSLEEAEELCFKWNLDTDLLHYAFTPRFAITCSRDLMMEIGIMARKHKVRIQTHLSENLTEIQRVRELFPECSSYTDVYNKYGILSPNTILGHAIHLSNDEITMLVDNECSIAHCPDSNFFLNSGQFPLDRLRNAGLSVGLASDIAAGTTPDMFYHQKMMLYRQNSGRLELSELLYTATLGSAKVLRLEHETGSIEVGKSADIIFINSKALEAENVDTALAELIFLTPAPKIEKVFVAGKELL